MLFQGKREFYLEDVIETNRQFPRTFLIPTKEEISGLSTGTLVKLVFVMEKQHKSGCRAEKMWVTITDIQNENDLYTGILNNVPRYLKSIKEGDSITFKAENIASIYGGKSVFNEQLFAIITRKALDARQINRAVKTEDLYNEQDSGWQLFYGDEDEQYLDDVENGSVISLEHVLSFEPLLENVFSGSDTVYEYSEDDNMFVAVTGNTI